MADLSRLNSEDLSPIDLNVLRPTKGWTDEWGPPEEASGPSYIGGTVFGEIKDYLPSIPNNLWDVVLTFLPIIGMIPTKSNLTKFSALMQKAAEELPEGLKSAPEHVKQAFAFIKARYPRISQKIGESIRYKPIPEVNNFTTWGQFNPRDNSIDINSEVFDKITEDKIRNAAKTMIHEGMHKIDYGRPLRSLWSTYVHPTVDYEKYYAHPLEVRARAAAKTASHSLFDLFAKASQYAFTNKDEQLINSLASGDPVSALLEMAKRSK